MVLKSFGLVLTFALTACGGSGHVDFNSTLTRPVPVVIRQPAKFNLVLGSQALATTTNGYKAKIQLSALSGITSTATNGFSARVRFATRNR